MTITVRYTDEEGYEVETELPAKFEVCYRCDGHGTHLNPSIGEHAYSPEEFDESFDEEERGEYFKHGGMYDVSCEECHGKRVTLEVDEEEAGRTVPEILSKYHELQTERAAYEAECAAERRMGA